MALKLLHLTYAIIVYFAHAQSLSRGTIAIQAAIFCCAVNPSRKTD